MAPLSSLALAAGLFSSLFAVGSAQSSTDCNPTERTDCPPDPALGTNATFNFRTTQADPAVWNATAGTVDFTEYGGDWVIGGQGDSVTIISQFYLFFGRVSVMMKAAEGDGIVSSIVLMSDDLDEVDWEWVGGNHTHVQTNYFGKGDDSTYDRDEWHPVDAPQSEYRNYTTIWTKEKIEWYIEGDLVRTLNYEDAKGGTRFPQTPMTVGLSLWAGGDPEMNKEGTVEWAGGPVDWSQAPFTMTVQSLQVEDFSTGKEYVYGDQSGSWDSIKVINGTSDVTEAINDPEGVEENWDALPQGAQIAIICVVVGVVLVGAAIMAFCCFKQRRAGRIEHARLEAEFAKEHAEVMRYREMMRDGDFAHGTRI